MRKTLVLILGLALALTLAACVYAEEDNATINGNEINYDQSPVNKLGRGLVNTATCWSEIPNEIMKTSEKTDPVVGCTVGTVKGIVTTVVRGFTGLFEAVTFFVPPYDEPIMKPEYALKNADDTMKRVLW